jgi:hypothetical protein
MTKLVSVALFLGIMCTPACVVRTPQDQVTAVASALRDGDGSIRKALRWQGNIKGEGIVVYVRPESGCEPRFAWIGFTSRTFALDEAGHQLTPSVPISTAADVKKHPGPPPPVTLGGRSHRAKPDAQPALFTRALGTSDVAYGFSGSVTVTTRLIATSVSTCFAPLGHRSSTRSTVFAEPRPKCTASRLDDA